VLVEGAGDEGGTDDVEGAGVVGVFDGHGVTGDGGYSVGDPHG
jgi:hypothetical protein